jgi:preprotein translocase subunit Sss1
VKKQVLRIVLKYGLGLGLLAYVIWCYWRPVDGSPGLADALEHPIHPLPLLLAALICTAGVLLTFVRWYILVRAQDLPFTVSGALRLGFIGYFLSSFLPGSVSGDIVKAAFIARQQDRRTVAVATVLIDRLIGLCGLFWLVAMLGGIFWAGGWLHELAASEEGVLVLETIVGGAGLLTAGSIVFWLLLGFLPSRRADIFAGRLKKIPKIGGSLAELWRAVWMYRCRGRSVGLALGLALVGHVGFVLTLYLSAHTLCPPGEVPALGPHFLVVPVGMTIQAGFPAPGGVGGGEYAFGKLYEILGFAMASGVLAALVQRAITWALGLVGYIVYLRMRPTLQPVAGELGARPVVVAKAG